MLNDPSVIRPAGDVIRDMIQEAAAIASNLSALATKEAS